MNETQKVIKYIAIALGAALAVTIIGSIIFGILVAGSALTGVDLLGRDSNMVLVSETVEITEYVHNIDIDLGVARLEIRPGEQFKVVLNDVDENTRVEVNNYTLRIEEQRRRNRINFFGMNNANNQQIIVYIPANVELQNVSINSGVGRVYIESLIANNVDLELGVGEVRIRELVSRVNTRINGGVGRLAVDSGYMRNLTLNSGVGETDITGQLTGNSRLDSGVGSLSLNLAGDIEDYTIRTDTGIGTVRINGERHRSGTTGNGPNRIDINGGIGSIDVTIR